MTMLHHGAIIAPWLHQPHSATVQSGVKMVTYKNLLKIRCLTNKFKTKSTEISNPLKNLSLDCTCPSNKDVSLHAKQK